MSSNYLFFIFLALLTGLLSAAAASQVCPARPAGGVSSSPLTALPRTVKEERQKFGIQLIVT